MIAFTRTFMSPSNLSILAFINVLALYMHPVISQHADIIFFNGPIITMEENFVPVKALAVSGGKILTYGSQEDVMKFQIGHDVLIKKISIY